MPPDWSPLRHALAQARDAGPRPTFWWRDDDAETPTVELDRLADLAAQTQVPVHLAVVSALADQALSDTVIADPNLIPVVHGWRHADTSVDGAKKSEFGRARPDAAAQTGQALSRLQRLFDTNLIAMFVPPWNRIDPSITATLAAQGYTALSTFGPRPSPRAHGLHLINTHIDPIHWRGDRSLADPVALIVLAADHILTRPHEPLGLLTHHLVHTPQVWDFTERLLNELRNGGAQPYDIKGLVT